MIVGELKWCELCGCLATVLCEEPSNGEVQQVRDRLPPPDVQEVLDGDVEG